MTYEPMHPDPDAEQLLCTDEELAQAGFSIGYREDMPETDSEFVPTDGIQDGGRTDALLCDADLETPEDFARAMSALEHEMQREGAPPAAPPDCNGRHGTGALPS